MGVEVMFRSDFNELKGMYAILMRRPIEKPAKMQLADNPKICHGVFAISIKPTFLVLEWSVFHLDDVDEISLDISTL